MSLQESARQRLRREVSLVRCRQGARYRVVLAYPNTYRVGMGNLGFHTLYRLFNEHPEVCCERVFLPDRDELDEYRRTRTPLFSLESRTPVADFDMMALSASFENDYPNILTLLELARIPFRTSSRDQRHPLVLMGGATVSINPEPVAPFLDLCCVGEGEELVKPLLDTLLGASSRQAALATLAQLPGFYVPALYVPRYAQGRDGVSRFSGIDALPPAPAQVTKVRARFGGAHSVAATVIRAPDVELGDRALIEVARGCTKGCRYCWVGYSILPFRVHRPEDVLEVAERWRPHTDRIGLVATALLDHPQIEDIVATLRQSGFRVFSPSLIISTLREPLLRAVVESGQRTITIAPEAGSDRMRRLVMKRITNQEILVKVRMIFRTGALNLKNYIIIGLPGETEYDLAAIVKLAADMREIMIQECRSRGRIGTITLSINCLIPKPGTPLQWAEQISAKAYRSKLRWLRRQVAKLPNVVIDAMPPRAAEIQAVMSRGDRRVADLLELWHEYGNWPQALRQWSRSSGISLAELQRSRDPLEPVPWGHLRIGPAAPALINQWDQAMTIAAESPGLASKAS